MLRPLALLQGTNAHMVLARCNDSAPLPTQPAAALWHTQRFWPLPPALHMVQRAARGRDGAAHFTTNLGSPGLAFLWDHQVCSWGRVREVCSPRLAGLVERWWKEEGLALSVALPSPSSSLSCRFLGAGCCRGRPCSRRA